MNSAILLFFGGALPLTILWLTAVSCLSGKMGWCVLSRLYCCGLLSVNLCFFFCLFEDLHDVLVLVIDNTANLSKWQDAVNP